MPKLPDDMGRNPSIPGTGKQNAVNESAESAHSSYAASEDVNQPSGNNSPPEKSSKQEIVKDGVKQTATDAGMELAKGNVTGAKKKLATGAAKTAINASESGKASELVEQGEKATNVVEKVGTAISVVSNNIIPFIVAVALVVTFSAVYATTQIFGKNESACASSGSDDSNVNVEGSKDAMKNANAIGTWFMKTKFKANGDKPLSKEQMAGVIGNAYVESGIIPPTTQSHFNDKINNDEVIALGKGNSGKAIGVFQFDASLRYELAKFAKSKNKPWQDLGTQLEFTKKWLDGEVEGSPQVKNTFKKFLNASDKTPSGYAFAWNDYVEVSGSSFQHSNPMATKRADFAKSFINKFQPTEDIPSADGGGGDGSACAGGDFDNSGIVKMAISIAWPRDQREKSLTYGDAVGKDKATPGYIAAKAKAEQLGGKDPQGLYASCDRFAATVIRNTVDKNFPWGSTATDDPYVRKHKELYQEITKKSELKPGDILLTHGDGHIAIYLGKYQGIDSVAQASYTQHTGLIGGADYWNESLVDGEGRPFSGWRYIGPGGGGGSGVASEAETSSAG